MGALGDDARHLLLRQAVAFVIAISGEVFRNRGSPAIVHGRIMFFASAPIPASSDSNVELILVSAGVVLVTGLLGFAIMRLSTHRGQKKRDLLLATVILWGILTAGSGSFFIMQQMNWSTSYQQQLMSGYGNPNDQSDRPSPPAVLWSILGAGYIGMLGWANRHG